MNESRRGLPPLDEFFRLKCDSGCLSRTLRLSGADVKACCLPSPPPVLLCLEDTSAPFRQFFRLGYEVNGGHRSAWSQPRARRTESSTLRSSYHQGVQREKITPTIF